MTSIDPSEIYLQPPCCTDPAYGRTWCERDPLECDDGVPSTKYIRADLAAKGDAARILLRSIAAEAERTGSWYVPPYFQEMIAEVLRG